MCFSEVSPPASTAFMRSSHLLLFPLSSKWNIFFYVSSSTRTYLTEGLCKSIEEWILVIVFFQIFQLFSGGKHLKVRTPLLVSHLTKACFTSIHYWKKGRQRDCHKQERRVIHSFNRHFPLAHRPFSPTEGLPPPLLSYFEVFHISISSKTKMEYIRTSERPPHFSFSF